MSWRTRYLRASFRSVRFFVRRTSAEGGRNVVVHEFPRQSAPFHEDLGKRARTLNVTAYVLGADYDLAAKELERVLDEEGPGTLIHPEHGLVPAVVLTWTRRDDESEGGFAAFDIEFQEKDRKAHPRPRPDFKKLISLERASLLPDSVSGWLAKIKTSLVPAFVTDAITGATSLIGNTLQQLDVFSGPAAEVAALQKNITNLLDNASSLLTAPADLANAILDAVEGISRAAPDLKAAQAAYENLLGTDASNLKKGGSSTMAVAADTNAQVTVDLMRWAGGAGAIAAAQQREWTSYDEAVESRDRIDQLLDVLLHEAPDSVYTRLVELQGLLLRSVPSEDQNLPRLETVVLPEPAPSLVLAYRRYGSLNEAAPLVARNRVRHPAYVPAGEPLELLVDGN